MKKLPLRWHRCGATRCTWQCPDHQAVTRQGDIHRVNDPPPGCTGWSDCYNLKMQQHLLSELIEQHVSLGTESATGFRAVRCLACNDHSERAGFKFDGDTVGFSCFNCGSKLRYEEGSGKLGRDAKRILEAFGISRQELDAVTGSAFFNKPVEVAKDITLESLKPQVTLFTPEVPLPAKSYPLGVDHNDELQLPLIEYILSRGLDPLKLNAHFSLDPKFLNRVIIPCMREKKIIFWQARHIQNGVKPRYLAPGTTKEAVLWGYDNLWKDPELPLFVTEGIFDAATLDGVALLGSKLNESKLEVLNRCRRRKIVVVDRDENGRALAELALEQGWEITFPPATANDVNDSLQKYGKLFTIWMLMKSTTVPTGMRAADGKNVQSQLELGMQLALAKLGKR